jgi:hypothetical protein
MAQFPCEHSNHAFRGKAQYFYPAVVLGQDVDRRRFRLCAKHADVAHSWLVCYTALNDEAGEADYEGAIKCPVCHEPVATDYRHFFCTAFVDVDDEIVRRDFYAPIHLGCLGHAQDAFTTLPETQQGRPERGDGRW